MPAGEFRGRDGRGPWRVPDPQGFADASFAYSAGSPIPVDYDHALVAAASNARTPAPAAGWISELAARPNGVWGLTEWTPRAAAQIAAKEYRFISPVFMHTRQGDATGLAAAALTNQPSLTLLTAVCSTESRTMDLDQLCQELRPLFGLKESAQPDAIVEAARRLQTQVAAAAVNPAPDKFVPMAVFERVVSDFNAQNRGVSSEAAQIAVDQAVGAGRLMPAMKDWAISLCSANKPAFDAFLERTASGLQAVLTPMHLRRQTPPGGGALSDIEREIAERCGLTPEDFK